MLGEYCAEETGRAPWTQ